MAQAHTETFQTVAREWWEKYMQPRNAKYAEESWRRLEREVMPRLGSKPLKAIKAPMILTILQRIERRGTLEVVRKVKSHISQIMRYGIATGRTLSNPARDLTWALMPKKTVPRAAITEPRQIGRLLYDIDTIRSRKRRLSLVLAALTFVRPGELAAAAWDEIEWDSCCWRIPAHKMKMKRPHVVPLSRQAMDVLRELRQLTGDGPWLFPSRWDKTLPEQGRVLNSALRKLGYGAEVMTAHGFRAMAASTLSEQGWASEVIERQLAHVDKNQVRAAYQRSELLPERTRMMQAWADYLDLRYAAAIRKR